jgi:hypothetical protein
MTVEHGNNCMSQKNVTSRWQHSKEGGRVLTFGLRVLGGCRLQLAFKRRVGMDEIASQMSISHGENRCKNELRQMENILF